MLFSLISLTGFPYFKGRLWNAFKRKEFSNSPPYFLEHQFDQTREEDQAFKAACSKHGKRFKRIGKHTLFLRKLHLATQEN